MCIGIPMRVIESDGFTALCEGRGGQRRVNVMLLDGVEPGAWVLIHLDSAVRLIEPEEAAQIDEALEALSAALNGEATDQYFADLRRH